MSLVMRPITGRFLNADLTPKKGYIEFTTTTSLISTGDQAIIVIDTIRAKIDNNGYIFGELASTESPDVSPAGWLWSIEEKTDNGEVWWFELPLGDLSEFDITASKVPGLAPPSYQVQGTPGPKGDTGSPGTDGIDGIDGKDGTVINIGTGVGNILRWTGVAWVETSDLVIDTESGVVTSDDHVVTGDLTLKGPLNLETDSIPVAPVDGQVWKAANGTIYMRSGGVTVPIVLNSGGSGSVETFFADITVPNPNPAQYAFRVVTA